MGCVAEEQADAVVVRLVVVHLDVGVRRVTEVQTGLVAAVCDVVVEVAAGGLVVEQPVLLVVGEHHPLDLGTGGVHEEGAVEEALDGHVLQLEALDWVGAEPHAHGTEDLVPLRARVGRRRVGREQKRLVRAVALELDEVLVDVEVLVVRPRPDLDLVARLGGVDGRLDGLTGVHRVGGAARRSRGRGADDGGCHPRSQHRGRATGTERTSHVPPP
jgi:hypothetical protein